MNKQGTFQITKNNTNLYSYTLYHKLHVFLLCFVLLFYWAYTRTEFEISKQLFLRVSPRGLCLKKICTSWRGLYWTTKQGTFQFQITKNNTNLYSYTLYHKLHVFFLCFVLLFYWAYTRTEFEISKQLFLRVSPRGLCLKKFCTSWRGLYWTTKQGTFRFQITKNNTNFYFHTL